MASFTTSNVPTNSVGRELSIASSFVKQYYTLLNKAPCFIYNFYSHDSTFIHGTIEMANEHYTEPVVGREKIKKKMEDLKLNDCRAKIKQIDCLETLAGGLVIQVIGELSNNGKPMRRFLQTFVLAPSPDESRQDGDQPQHASRSSGSGDRRGVHLSENNNSSAHNQKFFVLNSIFRYQDDGSFSEFEDDVASTNANITTDSTNGGSNNTNEVNKVEVTAQQQQPQQQQQQQQSQHQQQQQQAPSSTYMGNSNGSANPDFPQGRRRPNESAVMTNVVDEVGRLAKNLEEGAKINKSSVIEGESKREMPGSSKVVSNGTGSGNVVFSAVDKKNETSEKTAENGKVAADHSSASVIPDTSGPAAVNQPAPINTMSRPQPSNEPKTWANMVRNAHPPAIQINVTKIASTDQTSQQQQQQPNSTSSVQAQQQQQQQPQQQQNSQNNNNRRRHMMRKTSNKSTGRAMKSRTRPPALPGKPVV